MTFDSFIVVDWSGGNDRGPTPKKDAIWAAVVRGGEVQPSQYLRNRQIAEAWLFDVLTAEIAAGRRALVGFDFPFGYPHGFAKAVTGSDDPLVLWDWFAQNLTDTPESNNRYALADSLNQRFPETGPFWFNGSSQDLAHLPRKGRDVGKTGFASKRLCETLAKGAFSCWQMGGAGAVGSQVMTGMASLSRLRARLAGQISVWPFQPLASPIALVEVWPSLYAADVRAAMRPGDIKDEVQVRLLAARLAQAQSKGVLDGMLKAAPPVARRDEGWILGVETSEGKQAMQQPTLTPPRLRDDCFAMPQGVAWTPVEDALARLRAALHPVTQAEATPIGQALGRVLAADVTAQRANPPHANSAVDGYGFAHAATGAGICQLPLAFGRAAAGQPFTQTVPHGQAIRILTGAILPEGVDTVVLEEDCAITPTAIAFDGPIKPRANTRRAGEDLPQGAVALQKGHKLRAPDLALIAATGTTTVQTYRRLRVGVLSTGDEIVSHSAEPHQIYDANRPMLLALAAGWGFDAIDLGHSADIPAAIRDHLNHGAETTDVILTSGGASAGDEDHVSHLLATEGSLSSWRIAMKPGRPLALAIWQGTPVLGLPGNPVAALTCALIFARPTLFSLAGAGWQAPQRFTLPAAFSKSKKAGRREYLRARLNADGHAEVFPSEGSGRISGLSWATGLVELPDAAAEITLGTPVQYLPYSGFGMV